MRSAYAFRRPVLNAYLVRERDRRRRASWRWCCWSWCSLGGGLLAYTWIHLEALRTGYRIDLLERAAARADRRSSASCSWRPPIWPARSASRRGRCASWACSSRHWSRWCSGRSWPEAPALELPPPRRGAGGPGLGGADRPRLYQLQVVRHDHYLRKARPAAAARGRASIRRAAPSTTPPAASWRSRSQVDSAYAVPPEIGDPRGDRPRARRAPAPGSTPAGSPGLLGDEREFVWVARKLDPPVAAARAAAASAPASISCPRASATTRCATSPRRCSATSAPTTTASPASSCSTTARSPASPACARCCATHAAAPWRRPDLFFAEPRPGGDLHLTLDADRAAHGRARAAARRRAAPGAQRGSAVFLDPATGAVLAMASLPAFDPNEFEQVRARAAGATAPSWTPTSRARPSRSSPPRRRSTSGLVHAGRRRSTAAWAASPSPASHPRPQALRLPDLRRRDRQVEQRRGDQGRPPARRRAPLPTIRGLRLRPDDRRSTCRARTPASSIRSSAGGR